MSPEDYVEWLWCITRRNRLSRGIEKRAGKYHLSVDARAILATDAAQRLGIPLRSRGAKMLAAANKNTGAVPHAAVHEKKKKNAMDSASSNEKRVTWATPLEEVRCFVPGWIPKQCVVED